VLGYALMLVGYHRSEFAQLDLFTSLFDWVGRALLVILALQALLAMLWFIALPLTVGAFLPAVGTPSTPGAPPFCF
jgi:hypothetical protein